MLKRKYEEDVEVAGLQQKGDEPTPAAASRTPPSSPSPGPMNIPSKRQKTDLADDYFSSLTRESLRILESSIDAVDRPAAVESWTQSMAASSASSASNGKAASDSSISTPWRQPTLTQSSTCSTAPRTRSSSPSKRWQNDRTYRRKNLYFANVLVDVYDIPEHASACVASIRAAARNFTAAPDTMEDTQDRIRGVASEWREQSRIHVADSTEADWQGGLQTVLNSLKLLPGLGSRDLRFPSNQGMEL